LKPFTLAGVRYPEGFTIESVHKFDSDSKLDVYNFVPSPTGEDLDDFNALCKRLTLATVAGLKSDDAAMREMG